MNISTIDSVSMYGPTAQSRKERVVLCVTMRIELWTIGSVRDYIIRHCYYVSLLDESAKDHENTFHVLMMAKELPELENRIKATGFDEIWVEEYTE